MPVLKVQSKSNEIGSANEIANENIIPRNPQTRNGNYPKVSTEGPKHTHQGKGLLRKENNAFVVISILIQV